MSEATLDNCPRSPHAVHEFLPYVYESVTYIHEYQGQHTTHNSTFLVCKWCRVQAQIKTEEILS